MIKRYLLADTVRPLNDILYDQNEPSEVMEYVAAIDREYERLYHKMKDRV